MDVAESITITDNRTGESIEVPILDGGVDAAEWRKLLPGIWFYDPALMTTASTSSAITELDGENGILRYRGYPIEQLAEQSTYLEVAYLLIHGELPTPEQFDAWRHDITYHTFIHENVRKRFLEGFHYDAHPMGMLVSAIAALSTFYPDASDIQDPDNRYKQIVRLIAKLPTLAAACHRFSVGMPFVYPDNSLGFCENFLSMMWKVAEPRYDANPALAHALDVLFILHADHEQNCGTTAMRTVASAHADPYMCTASAAAALYGPRHGGANEAVIHMLTEIGIDRPDPAVHRVGEVRQGPPARASATACTRATTRGPPSSRRPPTRCSRSPARTRCSTSPSRSKRWRCPTTTSSPASSTRTSTSTRGSSTRRWASRSRCSRCSSPSRAPAGWLAHWVELLEQDQKIARPRQLYTGTAVRDYVAPRPAVAATPCTRSRSSTARSSGGSTPTRSRASGEIAVAVRAAGISNADLLQRRRLLPAARRARRPTSPGSRPPARSSRWAQAPPGSPSAIG